MQLETHEIKWLCCDLTISIFIWLSIAGRVILYNCPVHAVAQTFVHVHCHLVGHSYEQIHEESAFPTTGQSHRRQKSRDLKMWGIGSDSFPPSPDTNLSEISSSISMSLAARPSRLNSGATDRAVTWPCHSSRATDPSAFPITARKFHRIYFKLSRICSKSAPSV